MALPNTNNPATAVKRVRIFYGLLMTVLVVFGVRLFYVQVIKYGTYKDAALSDQLKQKEIAPSRGLIEAYDGSSIVPIVLNQAVYTVFADPIDMKTYHTNITKASDTVASILGGNADTYRKAMTVSDTHYSILAKKVTQTQLNALQAKKITGIYSTAVDERTYPQGALAGQVLGFVNDDGTGTYGIEQAMNKQLTGTPGELKAITDVNGVPLAATKGNVERAPVNGKNVVTSINLSMQAQMETILANEYKKTKSKGLSAVIMDPTTGQIKAMANYPSYSPANYENVTDPSLFQNAAVSNAIEPGSTMKVFTTAAGLNQGVFQPNSTFYDPAHWLVDGFNITDIEQDGGAREQSVASTLALSLNTGATWMLMQMGGGMINQKGINAWHDYMVNHFRFGDATNVEQGYESAGLVPSDDPSEPALALKYANTSFGQGVQVTALQMAAGLSSILNGGTYYQPTLIDRLISANGTQTVNKPKVLGTNTVSAKVGQEMIPLMENVVSTYHNEGYSYMSFGSQYSVGGKTGTAQIANPAGGYYADKFNGTYLGFVGGDKPQYVIAVFNTEPDVAGYAGANGGQPVFGDLAHMLINGSFVSPKSH